MWFFFFNFRVDWISIEIYSACGVEKFLHLLKKDWLSINICNGEFAMRTNCKLYIYWTNPVHCLFYQVHWKEFRYSMASHRHRFQGTVYSSHSVSDCVVEREEGLLIILFKKEFILHSHDWKCLIFWPTSASQVTLRGQDRYKSTSSLDTWTIRMFKMHELTNVTASFVSTPTDDEVGIRKRLGVQRTWWFVSIWTWSDMHLSVKTFKPLYKAAETWTEPSSWLS